MLIRELSISEISKMLTLFDGLRDEYADVSFTEVHSEKEIEGWLHHQDVHLFVAIDQDEVIGVMRAIRQTHNRDHEALTTIAVGREHRNKGVAKLLVNHSIDKLRDTGVKLLRAYVYSNNKASILTHLSCGFTCTGSVYQEHYDEKTSSYIDDLIFHKIL